MHRLLMASALLAWLAGAASAEPPLAITHVSVLPMDAERVLPDQTVVIEDGRLTALGASAAIGAPDGATVIDGTGLYLLPGLFDTHVHLRRPEAETHLLLHLVHGVTTVQSLSGSPRHLELRRRVREGEILGPRILTTGPTTARARVDSPEKAEAFVREQREAGYDAIKMYGDGSRSMTEETYARVIGAAHEAGLRVTGHAPRNHPFSLVLEHGQDSIDHAEEILYTYRPITDVIGPLLDAQFGRAPPEAAEPLLADVGALRARLEPVLDGLAREVRASGLAIAPTLVAFRTIWQQTTADYAGLLEMPQMRWMHPLTRAEWGPELNGYRSSWKDRLELVSRVLRVGFDTQMAMMPRLAAAGVPILAGTDAPLEFVFPGWALHRELELLVEAGLSPYQALRAATATAAEQLGLGADSGTVAVGKRADLVLVEANPLHGIGNSRRIAGVVAAGRWLPRAELDRRVVAATAAYERLEAEVEPLMAGFAVGDAAAIGDAYRRLDTGDEAIARFAERLVNSLGYERLGEDDAEAAVAAFRVNSELFPDSANVWDSLGEGLMAGGWLDEALASYRRALEVDPDFANPQSYIAFLEEVVPARAAKVELSAAELERYAGDYGERRVRLEGGGLVYSRGEGEPRPLVPLGEHRFMIEGVGYFLMRFETGEDGTPTRIIGSYADGRTDESPRG